MRDNNMKNKLNIRLNGVDLKIDEKHIQRADYSGQPLEKPVIRFNHVAAASLMKQYVKAKYPQLTVSVSSSSFAGGNSVDVYLSDAIGNAADREVAREIDNFGQMFVYGQFNGMDDMYELKEDRKMELSGYILSADCKYLHVNNRAKHASVPDVCRMLVEMTKTENYVFGQVDLETAALHAHRFGASQKDIAKAIQLLVEEEVF
jgi:hypothetical protein